MLAETRPMLHEPAPRLDLLRVGQEARGRPTAPIAIPRDHLTRQERGGTGS